MIYGNYTKLYANIDVFIYIFIKNYLLLMLSLKEIIKKSFIHYFIVNTTKNLYEIFNIIMNKFTIIKIP